MMTPPTYWLGKSIASNASGSATSGQAPIRTTTRRNGSVGGRWDDVRVTDNQASDEPSDDAESHEGESWTNPFTAEFKQRQAALEAMPGFQVKTDLEALGRSGHIMYKNAEDLSSHAAKFLLGGKFAQELSDEYEKELVRFLHNYLTSIYSLIEAQRVVMRHCWGENSEFETGEYTDQRKAAFETGAAEFMTELRNYCTHRSVPLPGMSTTFSWVKGQPGVIENKLTLDRDTLLKWKKWTAPAKQYLKAKEEHFDLGPVIAGYVNAASTFFNWFVGEINSRMATEKSEYLGAADALKKYYEDETGLTEEFLNRPPPGGNRSDRRAQRKQPKRTTKRQRRRK
jgi:hypothetical protein